MGGAIVSVDAKAKQEQLIEFILILKFLFGKLVFFSSGGHSGRYIIQQKLKPMVGVLLPPLQESREC